MKPMEISFVVLQSKVTKTSRQCSRIFQLRRELIVSPRVLWLQYHTMVLHLLNQLLPIPYDANVLYNNFATFNNGLSIAVTVHLLTVLKIMVSIIAKKHVTKLNQSRQNLKCNIFDFCAYWAGQTVFWSFCYFEKDEKHFSTQQKTKYYLILFLTFYSDTNLRSKIVCST